MLLIIAFAQAACPSSTLDVTTALTRAEVAYVDLDAAGFAEALVSAMTELTCLAEPVDPKLAAHYHRVQGIRRFAARDSVGATVAFSAARAVDPECVLGDDLAPAGNALRAAWDAAALPGSRLGLVAPEGAVLLVDGSPSTDRPTDRPSLVQVLSPDGAVLVTAWLQPGEPVPAVQSVQSVSEAPAKLRAPRHPERTLAWGAGGAALGSVTAYGFAMQQQGAFDRAAQAYRPASELQAHQTRANGLVVTAVGLGVLSTALLTASLVTLKF